MNKELKEELIKLLELCLEWVEMEVRFPVTGADFQAPIKKIEDMIEKLQSYD